VFIKYLSNLPWAMPLSLIPILELSEIQSEYRTPTTSGHYQLSIFCFCQPNRLVLSRNRVIVFGTGNYISHQSIFGECLLQRELPLHVVSSALGVAVGLTRDGVVRYEMRIVLED
jgi:hypothetical protein